MKKNENTFNLAIDCRNVDILNDEERGDKPLVVKVLVTFNSLESPSSSNTLATKYTQQLAKVDLAGLEKSSTDNFAILLDISKNVKFSVMNYFSYYFNTEELYFDLVKTGFKVPLLAYFIDYINCNLIYFKFLDISSSIVNNCKFKITLTFSKIKDVDTINKINSSLMLIKSNFATMLDISSSCKKVDISRLVEFFSKFIALVINNVIKEL